jgi:glycosyltransferase involved in cell wall biosynthesis
MTNPLVSVIVLCYNHAPFVEEAIRSVINQSYQPVELIVIDDASKDHSREILSRLSSRFSFKTIINSSNLGNCASFNKAFRESKGAYIIDLAADDILLPERIKDGVEMLEKLPKEYGVQFCDAELIERDGSKIKTHYQRNQRGVLTEKVPEGWIFKELVERYFICTPTMMMRREVLEQLGGYDDNLTYEDFDFWVRSSRDYQYAFSDKVLVKKRTVKNSLSAKQKFPGNKHIYSTALVCKKAFELCREKEEFGALKKRIQYELKWAAATGNFKALAIFLKLFRQINRVK